MMRLIPPFRGAVLRRGIPDAISLNDPFDSKPRIFLESDTEEERSRYRENVSGAGVLCFSEILCLADKREEWNISTHILT
jgi:hypothetical protein